MTLQLLQYNVGRQSVVQYTLVTSSTLDKIDVIAIQEPIVNPNTNAFHGTRAARYWPMDTWGETQAQAPDKKVLGLRQSLHKGHSSVLIQLRTGKTGLVGFLHRGKVPGFNSCLLTVRWRSTPRSIAPSGK